VHEISKLSSGDYNGTEEKRSGRKVAMKRSQLVNQAQMRKEKTACLAHHFLLTLFALTSDIGRLSKYIDHATSLHRATARDVALARCSQCLSVNWPTSPDETFVRAVRRTCYRFGSSSVMRSVYVYVVLGSKLALRLRVRLANCNLSSLDDEHRDSSDMDARYVFVLAFSLIKVCVSGRWALSSLHQR
jgi:hypothetical protein